MAEIEGAKEFRRTLRKAGDDLKELKSAHKEAATIAAKASAALAPVRTGKLRKTIRAAGTKVAGILRAGLARVPYAGPIHWGWGARRIRAQPFLSDGARDSEGRWLPVYNDYVQHALDNVKGI